MTDAQRRREILPSEFSSQPDRGGLSPANTLASECARSVFGFGGVFRIVFYLVGFSLFFKVFDSFFGSSTCFFLVVFMILIRVTYRRVK